MSGVERTHCHNESHPGPGTASQSPKQNFGQGRIPDILECLANLSNDEVFTPPAVASAMLDLLPEHVWSDPNLKWLDIGCKTGVFLREAAKRLMAGLEKVIPSERDRIDHILGEMLYGIATSHLTGLVARRTLYSATEADSDGSSARYIANFGADGNIRFQPAEHIYNDGGTSCEVCGAPQSINRIGMDNYAYELIHTDNPQELFTDKKGNPVKFDVVIGNPPYQMNVEGTSDKQIFPDFVDAAKKLSPKFITLIIPSRWYAAADSGKHKSMGQLRKAMMEDKSIASIVDYKDASEVFPDNDVMGGVMYFLRDSSHSGKCSWVSIHDGTASEPREVDLSAGKDAILRSEFHYSVLEKVRDVHGDGEWMSSEVSSQTPFGMTTKVRGRKTKKKGDIALYESKRGSELFAKTFVAKTAVTANPEWVGKHKVLVGEANGHALKTGEIISQPFYATPDSACTQTFLVAGVFDSQEDAERRISLLKTKFSRFMLSLRKITQHTSPTTYSFVPVMDNDIVWTDAALYKHFGLTQEEIDHIEATIKDMP